MPDPVPAKKPIGQVIQISEVPVGVSENTTDNDIVLGMASYDIADIRRIEVSGARGRTIYMLSLEEVISNPVRIRLFHS